MILLGSSYFLQETPQIYTMSDQEPRSDLYFNNYLGLVDASHVNYALPPGSLERLSSETMRIDRFEGHTPSGGDAMFPLPFHPPYPSPHIQKAHTAMRPSERSPIPSCEHEDHIPTGLDTGISSVDTEFFVMYGNSNSRGASCLSAVPSLRQSPSHRVVHLKQGVHRPLADITLLFFIEWQEYLPGGISL